MAALALPEKYLEGILIHLNRKDVKLGEYWVELKGNIMYFYQNHDQHGQKPQNIGTLKIDRETVFSEKETAPSGFIFDLITSKYRNKFKCLSTGEGCVWKAFILGLKTGTYPKDVKILPGLEQLVKDAIEEVCYRNPAKYDMNSCDKDHYIYTDRLAPPILESIKQNESSQTAELMHRFYNSSSKTNVPSWFVGNCSRAQAEEFLLKARVYGNTLIRESQSYKYLGSYAITKLVETTSGTSFENYEIMNVDGGFKIRVDNQHEAQNCLADVLAVFVNLSGPKTIPLKRCPPELLGINKPVYQTKIQREIPATSTSHTSYVYMQQCQAEGPTHAEMTRLPFSPGDAAGNIQKLVSKQNSSPPLILPKSKMNDSGSAAGSMKAFKKRLECIEIEKAAQKLEVYDYPYSDDS